MAIAKATLGSFRQSPRKMRMVVNAVRGKKVAEALVNLDFIAKKAAAPVRTLISSALANAKSLDIPTENLIVKTIMVNGGPIMYRRRPASRGRAHPIRKRTSSIFLELGEVDPKKKVKIVAEKVVESSEPKIADAKKTKSRKPKKSETKS
ncbi:MAG: 50S ribosomal protein L22 [Minisyncoccia bacterium]